MLLFVAMLLAGHAPVTAEPLAVFDSLKEQLCTVSTLSATMERVRTFRSARRLSGGKVIFYRTRGSVYSYRSPGKYLFFCSRSLAYAPGVPSQLAGGPPAAVLQLGSVGL